MPRLGQTVRTLSRRRFDLAGAADDSAACMRPGVFSPNPGALKMLVYRPDGLAANAPMVVVLHGCTQKGEAYAKGAGWLTLADRFGFIVLCPEQTTANNPNRCFNWYQTDDASQDIGEAASIAAMTRQAIVDHDVDPSRVFITGLSAGGAMTAVMLATYPELFAGGAVIAGLPYGAATNLSEAFGAMMRPTPQEGATWGDKVRAASPHTGSWPPISIWHGEADTIVRPSSADALVRQWTDVHGVTAGPATARTPEGRTFQVWMSPAGDAMVEHHRIPGMAHGTPIQPQGPDGSGATGPYFLDVGISSSLEIAMGWGIATDRREDRVDTPAQRSSPRQPQRAKPSVATIPVQQIMPPGTYGVTAVIENALRAAGLMR